MKTNLKKKKLCNRKVLKNFFPLTYINKVESRAFIYVLCKERNADIKLVLTEKDRDLFLSKGYQLLLKKTGSKRELDLAKLTIKELVTNNHIKEDSVYLFKRLIKHLGTLGYSNNSLNRIPKKYIS